MPLSEGSARRSLTHTHSVRFEGYRGAKTGTEAQSSEGTA